MDSDIEPPDPASADRKAECHRIPETTKKDEITAPDVSCTDNRIADDPSGKPQLGPFLGSTLRPIKDLKLLYLRESNPAM